MLASGERAIGKLRGGGWVNWEIIFLAIVLSLAKLHTHTYFLARLESYFSLCGRVLPINTGDEISTSIEDRFNL